MKKLTLIAALLTLAACGFQPLYGREFKARQDLDLSAIRVSVDHTRYGQLLKAEIEGGINPDYERAEKLYELSVSLTSYETYLFVNSDGTSSRGDIDYRSTYTLRRILDGKVIQSGTINRVSSYNMSETADYASYVSEEDARKRGILEMAQDYKLRLANLLAKLNPSMSGQE
jgi:hypothetical protein